MTGGLDGRIAAALAAIAIAPGCREATVGQRTVSAAGPEALRAELAVAIYDELHAGWARPRMPPGQNLRDREVEDRFRELMPASSREVVRTATVLDRGPDHILARVDGVRVWVPRARMVRPVSQDGAEAQLRLPADRPALSSGYFLAESGAPWPQGGPVLRVYVHLTGIEAAFGAWAAVHGVLAGLDTGYRVKVASWPAMLPRRDGLVVYLPVDQHDRHQRDLAWHIAAALRNVRGIGGEVSVFAKMIAPGIALACEPADPRPGMRGLSFGEHRAGVLAEGLLRHAGARADGHRGPVSAAITDALTRAGIDPRDPSRNLP